MDAFNYGIEDFIPCEICKSRANSVHHIDCRGMGGSKTKDYIENLMANCGYCHDQYGDKKQFRQMLIDTHLDFMRLHGVLSVGVSHFECENQ